MARRTVQATKNYRLFSRSQDNRPTDIRSRRRLMMSMQKYGFLPCFPIVCGRDEKGNLHIKDGQHRLQLAESLGLPVYWIEDDSNFDVAEVNSGAKTWNLSDYAQKYAANGKKDYAEALEFCDVHGLPISIGFVLLAGNTGMNNLMNAFVTGNFKIKDRTLAEAVVGIYKAMVNMNRHLKNKRFIEACIAICRVKDFDRKRLITNAERCREKLAPFSTREAYLDMLESIYNFGRAKLFGLKAEAVMAMRERNPVVRKHLAKVNQKEPSLNGTH